MVRPRDPPRRRRGRRWSVRSGGTRSRSPGHGHAAGSLLTLRAPAAVVHGSFMRRSGLVHGSVPWSEASHPFPCLEVSMSARPNRGAYVVAILALGVAVAAPAAASADHPDRGHEAHSFTYAVYGDAPYGTTPTDTSETDATPAFIAAVNADKAVSTILHVGDIHSGSQFCTQAYDQQIADLWTGFADPMVYTPGDNEWADCHKKKEGGGAFNATTGQIDFVTNSDGGLTDYAGGNPVDNLGLVRSIFFPRPGGTLGSGRLQVLSQAQVDNRSHPTDGQYVENVLWQREGVLFVSVNVPGGSNNDADPWYGAPAASPQQTTEAANRTGAALRWIDRAFNTADRIGARSVVVMTQADMWDLDGKDVSPRAN